MENVHNDGGGGLCGKTYLGADLSQPVDETAAQQAGGSEDRGHQPVETGPSAGTAFELR